MDDYRNLTPDPDADTGDSFLDYMIWEQMTQQMEEEEEEELLALEEEEEEDE